MNHRTYDGQRFSPLARINKDNVKNLKLAYAVPLAGGAGKEFIEATPLAEDGFLYITDSWGVLYKIDAHLGRCRPHRLAHGPQAGEAGRQSRRRACGATSSSRRASGPARIIATDKDTGKVVWETNVSDGVAQHHHHRRAACHQGQDHVRRLGRRRRRARLDRRRSMPRPASCCGANTRSRRRASPAARPGRATTMPGRPAAAPSGSPAPTIPTPTRRCGASAIRCR